MSESAVAEVIPCESNACTHCGAERKDVSVPWCKKCGFHLQFNRVMDLAEYDLEQDAAAEEERKPTALDGLIIIAKKIPPWVWKVTAGLVVITLMSVAIRMLTVPFTTTRVVFVVTQMVVGKLTLLTAHFWCYLYGVTESDKFSLMDVLVRPIAVWGPTVRDLHLGPNWWRVAMATWGALAEILAVALIGGVAWERIWEAGPAPPPKKNLLSAVAEEARRGAKDAESLEEALAQVEAKDAEKEKKDKPAARRQLTDCVILGYIPANRTSGAKVDNEAQNFSILILATEVDGRLKYAGVVQNGISVEVRERLETRLPEIARRHPFVPCALPGNWVRPAITCRVSFGAWNKEKQIVDARFEQLLAEIETGVQ